MIVTSNTPFSAWGEIFGDDMAATAMIDRLIHHAEILSLKGDSYRLKDRDLGPRQTRRTHRRLTPSRHLANVNSAGKSGTNPTRRGRPHDRDRGYAARRHRPRWRSVKITRTTPTPRGQFSTGAAGSILNRP